MSKKFNIYKGWEHLIGNIMTAVDIETTGKVAGYHEIVQIAIVPLDEDYNPLPHVLPFYTNIKPKHPDRMGREAQDVHGLDITELQQTAPSQEKAADMFFDWYDNLNIPLYHHIVPLAHNWPFEFSFIQQWLGYETMNNMFHGMARDSIRLALSINDWCHLHGEKMPFKHVSLSYLCDFFKIERIGTAHDALSDALACATLYRTLLQRFPF